MAKTRVNCPNCRQPIVADIDQLFDVAKDPSAKQRLLSGSFNMVKCPNCGYQGGLATPIVYHDPQKELLLTYFPPELNVPRNEQEKLLGGLINQVVNGLTPEQRKGYLLRPQENLTVQSLVERVLEADGITKEVLQAQQQRLNLLQRLLTITDENALAEVIKQEDKLIDRDFFNIMNRLIEAAMMGGDQQGAQSLVEMQKKLIPLTTVGRQVDEQNKEVEAAVRSLEAAGKDLTREKLLDIIQKAPNDIQLSVIASLTRSGLDYQFFQVLSDHIDRARGSGRERLIELREKLLKLTSEIDKQMALRATEARKLLDKILQSPNITEATGPG
jgi:ribosomal protein S27E